MIVRIGLAVDDAEKPAQVAGFQHRENMRPSVRGNLFGADGADQNDVQILDGVTGRAKGFPIAIMRNAARTDQMVERLFRHAANVRSGALQNCRHALGGPFIARRHVSSHPVPAISFPDRLPAIFAVTRRSSLHRESYSAINV
ncbi:hypothetical protein GALL_479850 [mine drainage metagenome]|uniref:Uncharacterized protein n=1 Tax=mine drainage metagenome TaxID=410659 RepID=A0A1J5PS38_9ZZZZ